MCAPPCHIVSPLRAAQSRNGDWQHRYTRVFRGPDVSTRVSVGTRTTWGEGSTTPTSQCWAGKNEDDVESTESGIGGSYSTLLRS